MSAPDEPPPLQVQLVVVQLDEVEQFSVEELLLAQDELEVVAPEHDAVVTLLVVTTAVVQVRAAAPAAAFGCGGATCT